MKVRQISDIHTEFHSDNGKKLLASIPNEGVDVLIVCGDLSTGFNKRIQPNLKQLCDKFPHVIYVMGNHDHWGSSIEKKTNQLRDLDGKVSNLHFLECDRIKVEDKFFAGCTLWFPEGYRMSAGWCDFRRIDGGADSIFIQNHRSKEFLSKEVVQGDIVITHHLPSLKCVHPRWVGNLMNQYFVSEMDEVIIKNKPALWLFGHTHDNRDLSIENTRLLCNPVGYPEEGVSYNFDLIIDTEHSDSEDIMDDIG